MLQLLFIVFIIVAIVIAMKGANNSASEALDFIENLPCDEMTLEEFENLDENSEILDDFLGVYIICNESKNKYYVSSFEITKNGKNKYGNNLKEDVLCHFIGKGEKAIKKDYDNGNKFSVKLVRYKDKVIRTLKDFELRFEEKYDSIKSGYNR